MARAQKFERTELLDKAVEVFRSQGYEATSVQDLGARLGLHPGSLYYLFGDKHALYLEALDRYAAVSGALPFTLLEASGSKLAAIRRLFEGSTEALLSAEWRAGCLITNTAVERAMCDPEAAARVTAYGGRLEDAFYGALEAAQAGGELRPRSDGDLRALARYLASSLQGLRVTAKANPDPATLRDIVRVTLTALDAPAPEVLA